MTTPPNPALQRTRTSRSGSGHQAAPFMRYIIPIVCISTMLLVGCRHSTPMVHTQTPAQPMATPAPTRSLFITTRGSHTSPDHRWRVAVSEDDGSLHLSRLTDSGSATTSPHGWTAQAGWFAFIENESRVWAYDGDRALYLLTATQESSGLSGPRRFPCAVPPQIFSRLSEPARGAIEPHE